MRIAQVELGEIGEAEMAKTLIEKTGLGRLRDWLQIRTARELQIFGSLDQNGANGRFLVEL